MRRGRKANLKTIHLVLYDGGSLAGMSDGKGASRPANLGLQRRPRYILLSRESRLAEHNFDHCMNLLTMNIWTIFLVALWYGSCVSQDYTCSADRPCELGCCSNTGVCRMGPDFCGDSCISNCDSKSDCDPRWGMKVIQPRWCAPW
jgi:hypothetical protein